MCAFAWQQHFFAGILGTLQLYFYSASLRRTLVQQCFAQPEAAVSYQQITNRKIPPGKFFPADT